MTDDVRALADLGTPMAVRVAATLRLADHAGERGATLEQLAAATETSAPALLRLLTHLVTVGVFETAPGSDRYRATALGAQMRVDAPEGVRPLLDIHQAGGRAELAFVELLGTVRTNQAAYPRHFGRDFWADLDADPALRSSFDQQMNWRFRTQAPQIAAGYDWGRFGRVLDVGGGDATVLSAILDAHPDLEGRVLDLVPTVEAARSRLTARGLDGRGTAVAGSFFDVLPTDFDAYLVCDIVHDWGDADARAILGRCRDAAAATTSPGTAGSASAPGRVVLVEPIRGRGTSSGIDLFMLMCFGGGERSIAELTALAAEAGLALQHHAPVSDGRTLLEFTVA